MTGNFRFAEQSERNDKNKRRESFNEFMREARTGGFFQLPPGRLLKMGVQTVDPLSDYLTQQTGEGLKLSSSSSSDDSKIQKINF